MFIIVNVGIVDFIAAQHLRQFRLQSGYGSQRRRCTYIDASSWRQMYNVETGDLWKDAEQRKRHLGRIFEQYPTTLDHDDLILFACMHDHWDLIIVHNISKLLKTRSGILPRMTAKQALADALQNTCSVLIFDSICNHRSAFLRHQHIYKVIEDFLHFCVYHGEDNIRTISTQAMNLRSQSIKVPNQLYTNDSGPYALFNLNTYLSDIEECISEAISSDEPNHPFFQPEIVANARQLAFDMLRQCIPGDDSTKPSYQIDMLKLQKGAEGQIASKLIPKRQSQGNEENSTETIKAIKKAKLRQDVPEGNKGKNRVSKKKSKVTIIISSDEEDAAEVNIKKQRLADYQCC